MSVPSARGLVYIVAGAFLILSSRMLGGSGDIVADVAGAGLMWRGHSIRRPQLDEHGFHRAFPFVLGLFGVASFALGPEIGGLTRLWIIAWVAWVIVAADLPPGLRQRVWRSDRLADRLRSGTRSAATSS